MAGKKVVAGIDEKVAEFCLRQIRELELDDMLYSAIGQMDDQGNIVAGVTYTMFTGRDIHAHIAGIGKRWMTKRFLGEIFRYPFLQLGVARITCLIAADNEPSIRLCRHMGFEYEGVLRQFMQDGRDCLIFGMLRDECRWLNVGVLRHGTELRGTDQHRSESTGKPNAAEQRRIIPLRRIGEGERDGRKPAAASALSNANGPHAIELPAAI
jgi:hypothetical protein